MINHLTGVNPQFYYVVASMCETFVLHYYFHKADHRKKWGRVGDAVICQLLTAAISLPMIDTFTEIPASATLLVGAVIGTLGIKGWQRIARAIVEAAFRIAGINSGLSFAPPQEDEEPPSPIKRKTGEYK